VGGGALGVGLLGAGGLTVVLEGGGVVAGDVIGVAAGAGRGEVFMPLGVAVPARKEMRWKVVSFTGEVDEAGSDAGLVVEFFHGVEVTPFDDFTVWFVQGALRLLLYGYSEVDGTFEPGEQFDASKGEIVVDGGDTSISILGTEVLTVDGDGVHCAGLQEGLGGSSGAMLEFRLVDEVVGVIGAAGVLRGEVLTDRGTPEGGVGVGCGGGGGGPPGRGWSPGAWRG